MLASLRLSLSAWKRGLLEGGAGYVAISDVGRIVGWAWRRDGGDPEIEVRVDGRPVARVTAHRLRPDLLAAPGLRAARGFAVDPAGLAAYLGARPFEVALSLPGGRAVPLKGSPLRLKAAAFSAAEADAAADAGVRAGVLLDATPDMWSADPERHARDLAAVRGRYGEGSAR